MGPRATIATPIATPARMPLPRGKEDCGASNCREHQDRIHPSEIDREGVDQWTSRRAQHRHRERRRKRPSYRNVDGGVSHQRPVHDRNKALPEPSIRRRQTKAPRVHPAHRYASGVHTDGASVCPLTTAAFASANTRNTDLRTACIGSDSLASTAAWRRRGSLRAAARSNREAEPLAPEDRGRSAPGCAWKQSGITRTSQSGRSRESKNGGRHSRSLLCQISARDLQMIDALVHHRNPRLRQQPPQDQRPFLDMVLAADNRDAIRTRS